MAKWLESWKILEKQSENTIKIIEVAEKNSWGWEKDFLTEKIERKLAIILKDDF